MVVLNFENLKELKLRKISISILTTKSEADKAYVVKFFCNLVFTNL